jgi:hypothetical protein
MAGWWDALKGNWRAFKENKIVGACLVLGGHFVLLAFFITLMWFFEWYLNWLYGGRVPMLFGWFPWKWVFDGIDLVLVIAFSIAGAVECIKKLRG